MAAQEKRPRTPTHVTARAPQRCQPCRQNEETETPVTSEVAADACSRRGGTGRGLCESWARWPHWGGTRRRATCWCLAFLLGISLQPCSLRGLSSPTSTGGTCFPPPARQRVVSPLPCWAASRLRTGCELLGTQASWFPEAVSVKGAGLGATSWAGRESRWECEASTEEGSGAGKRR